jgi:hypothetical protein
MDKRFLLGARFIAPIQPEVHGKMHGTTDVMTGHGIVRERIRVVALIVMAVHPIEETTHMRVQGVIEHQDRVSLRTADRLRLLPQRREPRVVDAV